MPRAVAINVAANTSLPGFRGPVFPDGSFTYVPIPEREPTAEPVPTYCDLEPELDLPFAIPGDLRDRRVHLDPSFAEYPSCVAHTYGDEHGVKAGPISGLSVGDYLLFYATLGTYGESAVESTEEPAGESTEEPADEPNDESAVEWVAPEWGAYVIGGFRVATVLTGEGYRELPSEDRDPFAGNAHVRREQFDAKVLVRGAADSPGLLDRAVPLSAPTGGATANRVVTDLAGDSGKGPWWRRVLRFDEDATEELLDLLADPGATLDHR